MSPLRPSIGIRNASSDDVRAISNAPLVRGVMNGWFRALSLAQVVKQVVHFEVTEVQKPIQSYGIIQPLSGRRLEMKPEGQRQWDWILIHATPDLTLDVDDVIIWKGDKYRVQSQKDFGDYGFVEYELINDYVKRTR